MRRPHKIKWRPVCFKTPDSDEFIKTPFLCHSRIRAQAIKPHMLIFRLLVYMLILQPAILKYVKIFKLFFSVHADVVGTYKYVMRH